MFKRLSLSLPFELARVIATGPSKIVKHSMSYPMISKTDRKRLLPRHQWRFKAEFSDKTRQWMYWTEANQQQALDVYSREPQSSRFLPYNCPCEFRENFL